VIYVLAVAAAERRRVTAQQIVASRARIIVTHRGSATVSGTVVMSAFTERLALEKAVPKKRRGDWTVASVSALKVYIPGFRRNCSSNARLPIQPVATGHASRSNWNPGPVNRSCASAEIVQRVDLKEGGRSDDRSGQMNGSRAGEIE
jgi:hypothetical protein